MSKSLQSHVEPEMVTLHISGVPEELKQRIERLAKAERRSMSAFIVTHIEKRAAELEAQQQPAQSAA